jgi:hypothetical protein
MADIRNKRLNGNAPENPLLRAAFALTTAVRANTAIGRRKAPIGAAATNTSVLRRTVP